MKLNCDLGESYGHWKMGQDEQIMPSIDQANIACGFHAGDPLTMRNTIALARSYGVEIGAHPSYPDLVGFGRRTLQCSKAELISLLHYQIAAMEGLCRAAGAELSYVKPHGALYNDMMGNEETRLIVLQALSDYPASLQLMQLATAEAATHRQQAAEFGISLILEGFADRRYTEAGQLQARSEQGAVLGNEESLAQVRQLLDHGAVTTSAGSLLPLQIDSLCVHGDTADALKTARDIRQLLKQPPHHSTEHAK